MTYATPHVRLYASDEPGPPWRPAGWYAVFWTPFGLRDGYGPVLRGPSRTRAEAIVVLHAPLAEMAAAPQPPPVPARVRTPAEPRPPRRPPSTLTFEPEDGGWLVVWRYPCRSRNWGLRRTEVGPFATEQEARAWAAHRWQGGPSQ